MPSTKIAPPKKWAARALDKKYLQTSSQPPVQIEKKKTAQKCFL